MYDVLFTSPERMEEEINYHLSNVSSSTHNLSKQFPCYCFPQGAPINKETVFQSIYKMQYVVLCAVLTFEKYKWVKADINKCTSSCKWSLK